MPQRLLQLYLGLIAYGVSMVLMLQSRLGLMPWDVLHQGIALQGGWSMGRVAVATSFAVLLAWIPIRQKPGLGTISNAIVIGLVFDAVNGLIGDGLADLALVPRVGLLIGGIVLNALATAAYIGARFGPGPRDGLMTGLVRRSGWSVRLIRTLIEGGVLVSGFLLGGTLGLGTIAYMLAIGPLIQVALPWFDPEYRKAVATAPTG
ncbi:membrane protein YczE [Novilysobacter erysipheiresistens]|uniref:Membrane protein YczE n=1 Tax=Novilysobacter erysipheiresistens TaxID=1749332 RepID=A0ABU7YVT9_9GAMM